MKQFLAAALFASASVAQAGVILLDNFDVDQGPVSDTTPGNGAVQSTTGNRSISSNLLTALVPVSNSVEVAGGVFDVANGSGEDSEVTVDWAIAAGLIPAGATNPTFLFQVVLSDGNPTSVDFSIGGTSLGTFAIPANTSNAAINVGPVDPALFNAGGQLQLRANGAVGWDLTLDAFGLQFTDPTGPTPTPLPGTLALLGLGCLALGLRRRA
jgi:PEP-CTERM motif